MLKINFKDISLEGTHLQGIISTSFDTLVSKLGKPMEGDGDKTTVEWHIEKDGVVATVYDLGSHYYPHYNTDWHIGGVSKEAVELVNSLLK